MIHTARALITEGKYDKARLREVTDALVVTTDGFNIFKDTEKQLLIKRLAKETGLIVLTDSDDAGFRIRRYICDIAGKENVLNAYIPEVSGKEKRKPRPGSAGLLGVEGIDAATVEAALAAALQAECTTDAAQQCRKVDAAQLFEDGLSGCAGATDKRKRFLAAAGFPSRVSTKAMLELINRLLGYEEYKRLTDSL